MTTAMQDVSRETSSRLQLFATLLRTWNGRINLVGRDTLDHLMQRHVADSLQLLTFLPPIGSIADLGSGGGFPGLIIAIATGRTVTLVEADQRKATFLREAARVTAAPVSVLATRIEDCGLRDLNVVTARALAPLPKLLALAHPIIASDGVCLFLKGAQIERELTDADPEWQMSTERHASPTGSGCVLEVRHLRPRATQPP